MHVFAYVLLAQFRAAFEALSRTRLDLETYVQVDGAAARFFRVQVDFPQLAERVRLHEVALVMNVEPVVHCVALQVGHEARNVDDRHGPHTTVLPCPTSITTLPTATSSASCMTSLTLLPTLSTRSATGTSRVSATVSTRRTWW